MMPLPAQEQSPSSQAVSEAVLRQANTIMLRQKLQEAQNAALRGDLPAAAKLYEDAYTLVRQIGSGIDSETAQTISGLVSTHMELARRAQSAGDLREADAQVTRVLKLAPQDSAAKVFKKTNDDLLASMKGRLPDEQTLSQIPAIVNDKTQAATLVQDGKILYEAGKFEEAEARFQQALQLDPDSTSAFYYLNLTKQADYAREERKHTVGAQDKMVQIEKAWTPKVGIGLPVPNPYVTNKDIHTGAGRGVIYNKLADIQMNTVSWPDGLPLSEVIRYLSEQSKARDPEKVGINFLFNPNVEQAAAESPGGPNGGPMAINPQTGLPAVSASTAGSETSADPSAINIKLTLSNVRLQDLLNAIVLVADHPIKYSVEDYAIVFSAKPSGPEPPTLEMRVFNVDPNTFYQGLQSVSAFSFGSASSNNGGNGGGGYNGGGNNGGGNNGGGNNGNGNGSSGAVVPVISMAPGGGQMLGNGNGNGGNTANTGNVGIPGRAAGSGGGTVFATGGGVNFLTVPGYMQSVTMAAQAFFKAIGVDLTQPGRSLAFNDRMGLLFVKATPGELDTIERAVQALNQVAPEVHIKARFIEITEGNNAALGFDWYLGNFINGTVVANGGSAPSLTVPASAANPYGTFPGNIASGNLIPGSSSDQLITSGLSYLPTATPPPLATVTGILTDPNFRVVLRALQQRGGVQQLAEPEVVTTSGRQTQMRATDIQYIITGFNFQQGYNNLSTTGTGTIP